MSTAADPKYFRSNYRRTVEVRGEEFVDIFAPDYTFNLTQALNPSNMNPVAYEGEHIENLVFDTYTNTSLWWVVMIENGFIHPLEIQEGISVRMPRQQEIDNYTAENRSSQGERVVL
jgi:hypothetical protein